MTEPAPAPDPPFVERLVVLGPLGIPLDHCLHDASLAVVSRRTGRALGSDHAPLEVELVSR